MKRIRPNAIRAALALVGLAIVTGCGLKGPLTLPEKSKNVVIRDKQTGGTTGQPAGTSPGTPAAEEPQKLPPPELPRNTNGTNRGG